MSLSLYCDLAAVESTWRRFELLADCTPFQTFDWLATWHRHIGRRAGVVPVIAVGCFAGGETAFVLPLAVQTKLAARRLCWLGQDLCDYTAPLLARDFSRRVAPDRFRAVWRELRRRMQRDPRMRHDWIDLEKMPDKVGAQINPFTYLGPSENASGAHFTKLGGDWEKFYFEKRSSATRRHDRAKRRHLSEYGEIRFINTIDADDARRMVETLIQQKSRAFARKGIADVFARPGCKEFLLDLASNANGHDVVHISRIEIGAIWAAVNFGIVFGNTYYHFAASYDDSDLAHYGPGALHLRELMAYAIGLGLRRFDFTIGDEPYKLEWADSHLKLWNYAAAVTWRGWPASLWLKAQFRLKRLIKRSPWAWRAASRVRSIVGPLLHRPASPPLPPSLSSSAPRALQNAEGVVLPRPALAFVMGDMDLVRPIVSAGIPCAVMTRPGVPSLYSRFARWRLPWDDFGENAEQLVDQLVRFGKAEPVPPVLFYEEDAQLIAISRFRAQLEQVFRFVIADAPLVEDLLDKARFQALAERHGLPVPPARRFHPATVDPGDLDLRFPAIIKPLTRLTRWNESFGLHKAVEAHDVQALCALWPQLLDVDVELLAQELIPGAESQIESYHCYVDRRGSFAGEFTGRKIRTFPLCYGHTTALVITEAPDVHRQGRAIVERIGLTGVAKLDFKRDAQGHLRLLEINPRFNLWHHAGAMAGVNIPAIVYADLTEKKRPPVSRAKAGVRWCRAWKDFPAASASGVSLGAWLQWFWRCEAKSSLSWDDPMPLLRATLHRLWARSAG